MEFIAAIIIAHLIGDYLLQSHYMATEKTSKWWPAILHGIFYTLPFAVMMLPFIGWLPLSPLALLVIGGTHILIDRFRLAKYLVWLKNQIAPKSHRYPWKYKAPKPKPVKEAPVVVDEPVDAGQIVTGPITGEKIQAGHLTISADGINWNGPLTTNSANTTLTIRDTSKDNDPNTGFPKSTPAWLSVWLLIILDNTLHLLINIAAVLYL